MLNHGFHVFLLSYLEIWRSDFLKFQKFKIYRNHQKSRNQSSKSKSQDSQKFNTQNPNFKSPKPRSLMQWQGKRTETKNIYRKETTSQTSKIQKHKLKTQNQNDKIQFPKSKIQIPKSKLQSPNLEIQNPESKITTPKSKPRNPRSRIQNQNSKFQTTKTTQFYGSHGPHILDKLIDLDLMFLWTTSRGLKWKSKGSTSKNPKC